MSITARARHPLTVLVVDDSPDVAESLAEVLELHGHAVAVAFNGASALRSVSARVPDVILLDILMPGLDGYEVAERVRRHCEGGGRQPLLVAITGCGTESDRLRSASAGFDLHLVKPVDPGILVGILERFRRLLSPTIPADELELPSEDHPGAPGLLRSGDRFAACE